ncbi:MAG: glucose-1-phosphate adenylyltransferase family protein [bacterium]
MENVVAMVLAGGTSKDLPVLTDHRSNAALPFCSCYRVIDFCLSNCMNSKIYTVGLLAQYNPASLLVHIGDGSPWDLNRKKGGISILQPYTERGESNWFRGTADAIAQYSDFINDPQYDTVLVLSGDQVYKMDYCQLIDFHRSNNWYATVALKRCDDVLPPSVAGVGIDAGGRVIDLVEKPKEGHFEFYSLGIYAFRKDVLLDMLTGLNKGEYDLVFNILIPLNSTGKLGGFVFDGFWADIGSIERYHRISMDMLSDQPPIDLNDPTWPICSRKPIKSPAFLSPECEIRSSLIASGARIYGTVLRSIIFPGVTVSRNATVEDSIILDDVWIEEGACVRHSIIDKRARVGKNTWIGYGNPTCPNMRFPDVLKSGVTVLGTQTTIPDGIRIGRNCLIGSDLNSNAFPGRDIVCGETILGEAKWQKIWS